MCNLDMRRGETFMLATRYRKIGRGDMERANLGQLGFCAI